MIKKTGAVLLSLLLTALSAGPECALVLAGEFGVRPSLARPVKAISSKELLAPVRPAPSFGVPNLPAPVRAPRPAAKASAKTPWQRTMEDLAAPSPLEKVSSQAPAEDFGRAGREDFSLRVGEPVLKPANSDLPAGIGPAVSPRLGKAGRAAPLASLALSVPAAAAPGPSGADFSPFLSVAAGAALAASKAVLAGAVLYVGLFAAVEVKGRKIGEQRFLDFVRAEAAAGRLSPELAGRIKVIQPHGRFGTLSLFYWAGGSLYLRPGLTAWPFLFRRVVAYAGRSLESQSARGPPRNLPASKLEFAAERAGLSLPDVEPYDILISRSASDDLKDPAVYERLRDGRKPSLVLADLDAALADKSNARRFGAVVLDKPFEYLPKSDTEQRRTLERTLKQLHGQYLTATGREAEGADGAGARAESSGRYRNFSRLARRLSGGKVKTQEDYQRQLRDFWHQIVSSRLKGLALSRLVEGLYAGMQDKGLAFLSFAPDDPSLPVFEKFLAFWEAADGGEFHAVRVPQEDGGFFLALRKAEPRVGLWLKPPRGYALEESIPDANGSEESRRKAWSALERAGFEDHLEEFRKRGVEIEQVIGKGTGSELVFITVPRRHAGYVRHFVAAASIRVRNSQAGFESHMIESPALQGVLPLRRLGLRGAGGHLGVIDTGIDLRSGAFDLETTRQKDMGRFGWKDTGGHGTHVSGIMKSRDPLFTGLARDAFLTVYKVFGGDGGAADGPIVGALALFVQACGDVVNLSLGMVGTAASHLAQIVSRMADRKNAKGEKLMIVASAGNSGPFEYPLASLSQPGVGDNVTSVAAAAKSLDDGEVEMDYYTSVGPDRDPRYMVERARIKPDVTGIGGGVAATRSSEAPESSADTPDGRNTGKSGTSMASPMVAAIKLLVKTVMRRARTIWSDVYGYVWENLPLSVRAIVMSTAEDIEAPVWFQGAGLVSAWKAVWVVCAAVPQAAVLTVWGKVSRFWGGRTRGPFDWVVRYKNVLDLEDKIFEAVKISDEEPRAAADSEEVKPEGGNNQNLDSDRMIQTFRRRSSAALPYLLRRLGSKTEPSWLVRRQAASVLLNLRLPDSAKALAEAALGDPDARVRQMAFLALARVPTHAQDFLLRSAAGSRRWDVGVYAAYALARHGDRSGVSRLVKETGSSDKKARYAAVWLLGQLREKAKSAEAEVLSAKAKEASERDNIRHLAVAALANIALKNPSAVSAKALSDLLETAGPQNFALNSTIVKFFAAALRSPVILARLREEPLKTAVVRFVLRGRGAVQKAGSLGDLVQGLARVVDAPLSAPTPVPDPSGFGVAGVDADMGPLDVILELPAGRSVSRYWDHRGGGDPAAALAEAGLGAGALGLFEGRLKAAWPASNSLWISIPEHKLYAFASQMRRRGCEVRTSSPQYTLARRPGPPKAGLSWRVDSEEAWPALEDGADLSLVHLDTVRGASEAKVMGALEYLYARLGDPLKKPSVVVVDLGGAPAKKGRSPLDRLLNRLMLRNVGIVVPAGNDGPSAAGSAEPGLPVVVAAAGEKSGHLEWYSHRSAKGKVGITWADEVSDLDLDRPSDAPESGSYGTGAAAERTGEKLAALALRMAQGGKLPDGYFHYLVGLVKQTLTPMPQNGPHEVGGGLFNEPSKALARLEARLKSPEQVAVEAAALAQEARRMYGEPQAPPARGPASAWRRTAAAVRRLFARPLSSQDLTDILGDAAIRRTKPFRFLEKKYPGKYSARGAGLAGFIYSKIEMERNLGEEEALADWGHYFAYLDALLAPYAGAAEIRRGLGEIQASSGDLKAKNERLNAFFVETFNSLKKRYLELNPSKTGPKNVYMILARAYNRLKPGMNFFDSIDDEELARIKKVSGANVLWLLDIWEIGKVNQWGPIGSPYAVRRYHAKTELGGDEAFERLIQRAKKAGLILCVDEVPNHAAIDSDEMEEQPQNFIHIIPPQPEPGEDDKSYERRILSQVPRSEPDVFSPVYYAVKTRRYPGHEGRDFWILAHHPWSEDGKWVDMLQHDFTRPSARQWAVAQVVRLVKLGVRMFRRDMASYVINKQYYAHWDGKLEWEASVSQGWVKEGIESFLAGFRQRREAVGDKEILEEMVDAARAVDPGVIFADEGYQHFPELSAAKTDLVYNKVDLYDSMMDAVFNGNTARLRESLKNLAFRVWQKGGADFLNLFVTHDGGEGNPVDKFKAAFGAVAATALLHSSNLFYNGLELGLGQAEMLIGDLSKSTDLKKDIPFDIQVLVNWAKEDPRNARLLANIIRFRARFQEIIDKGAMDVLDPADESPIAAWTQSVKDPATGAQKTILAAANYSGQKRWGKFLFKKPVLSAFGAFQPRADRQYILKDYAELSSDGQPRTYEPRSGQELLEGLAIGLDGGAFHLFEIEEVNPNAPQTGPPAAAVQAKIFLTRHGQPPIAATLATLGGLLAAEPALKDDLNKNGKIRVVLAKSQPQAGLSEADLEELGAALRARGVTAKIETENILVDWQREGEKTAPGQAQGRRERPALWRLFAESLTKPTASEVLGGVSSKAFPFFVSMCTWALMYSGQKAGLPAASFSVAYVQALWSGLLANIQQAVVVHPRALAAAIGLSFSLDTFHGIWINSWNNFQNALGRERGLRYQTVFNFLYGQLWGVVFRSVAWSALSGVVPPWAPSYWKDVSLSAVIGTFFGTLGYQGLNTLYNNGRISRQTRSGIQQVRDLFFMLAGTFFGAGSMKSFWTVFALQQSLDFSIYLASQHLQSRPILYIADDAVAQTGKFQGAYPVSAGSVSPDSPLKQALQGLLNSPFVKPFVWLVKKALGKDKPRA